MAKPTQAPHLLDGLAIAEHQLKRAIQLYTDFDDYVSAVTLAGASEEILGKLLQERGAAHALKQFVETCFSYGRDAYGENFDPKTLVELVTATRNGLKHYVDGRPLAVSQQVAVAIIDRAIENYWRLEGRLSLEMQDFLDRVHGP